MRRTSLILAALVALSAFAAPLVAAPKGTNHNKSDDHVATEDCGDGNELLVHAPTTLWPPNHKYYTDLYVLATDEDGGEITLTTQGYHDQYDGDVEANGAGNTGDDITLSDDEAFSPTPQSSDESDSGYPTIFATETDDGEVQTDWKARAERSGRFKEGRTYTLEASAVFDDGECGMEYQFTVPHDMRKANRQG